MTTALLLVDVQRDMVEGPAAVPAADAVTRALEYLLARARQAGILIVHIQNDGAPGSPDEPDTPGWQLVFPVYDGELVVRKADDDSFAETALATELGSREVKRVVVAGMLSDCCVAATVRGALRHGLDVVLASGAHATYAEGESGEARAAEVERDLRREGALVFPAAHIDFRRE